MVIRRFPIAPLLFLGLGLLIGSALAGSSVATSWLAAPFIVLGFVFKVIFFFLLFGFVARMFGSRRHWEKANGPWSDEAREQWQKRHNNRQNRQGSRRPHDTGSSADRGAEDFDEWHRMAHAREEVDTHVPPVED